MTVLLFRSNSKYDNNTNTIYFTVKDGDLLTVMYTSDFFNSVTVIDDHVHEFLMIDDFYFTVKKVYTLLSKLIMKYIVQRIDI